MNKRASRIYFLIIILIGLSEIISIVIEIPLNIELTQLFREKILMTPKP